MIFIEFLVEVLIYFFIEIVFEKLFKPIFRYVGTLYLKFLNIFLKSKIDIEKSPNITFIGFLIFVVIGIIVICILVY